MHFNLNGLSTLFNSSLHTDTYVRTPAIIHNLLSAHAFSSPPLFFFLSHLYPPALHRQGPLTALQAVMDPIDNWNTNPIYSGA